MRDASVGNRAIYTGSTAGGNLMAEIIETPTEITKTPTRRRSTGLPARQLNAILSAIMAGAAFGNTTSKDPKLMVETYHAVYKELRDKGVRPKA